MRESTFDAGSLRAILVRGILDIGFFSVFVNLLLLAMPVYLLQVYDRILPASSEETLLFLSLIAIFALIFLGLLEVIRLLYAQRVASAIDQWVASPCLRTGLVLETCTYR